MLGFMSIFICPLLALYVEDNIIKEKKNLIEFILRYAFYLIIINYIILVILTFIFNNDYEYLTTLSFNNIFTVKYLSMSIGLSIFLPVLTYYLKNVFDFKLYVEKKVRHDKNK